MVSYLDTPLDVNLLWVELAAEENWDYTPPEGHQIAWCFAQRGVVEIGGEQFDRELAIFAESSGKLHFRAKAGCAFLLGTAAKHPHDLVLGSHSVHTSERALNSGVRRIAEIGERLRYDGKM